MIKSSVVKDSLLVSILKNPDSVLDSVEKLERAKKANTAALKKLLEGKSIAAATKAAEEKLANAEEVLALAKKNSATIIEQAEKYLQESLEEKEAVGKECRDKSARLNQKEKELIEWQKNIITSAEEADKKMKQAQYDYERASQLKTEYETKLADLKNKIASL